MCSVGQFVDSTFFSVLLRFDRSLKSSQLVEGRPIVFFVEVFKPSFSIVKDTGTLSHLSNFWKNLVSFPLTCCHFFLNSDTNLPMACFRLFGKMYGCFNFFDTSISTMSVTTLIFSFNTDFTNMKISSLVKEISSVLSRGSVENGKITSIEELSLPISYKQYFRRENYEKLQKVHTSSHKNYNRNRSRS